MESGTSIELAIRDGVSRLAAEGFVAYPTETVWGLGACATSVAAIERMRAWKGRASDAPMSVLVSSADHAIELGCRLEPVVRSLIDAYWPGPLTLVVPCDARFAPGVAREDGALGLRCSPHRLAHALASAVARAGLGPLTSTSLNRTGEAPAANLAEARTISSGADASDPGSPWIVQADGYDAGGAAPSSVVDCTGEHPAIVRAGAIDSAALEEIWMRSAPCEDRSRARRT